MHNWISDLLLFGAGIAAGILVMMILPTLSAEKKRRTELVAARSKILAGMKQKHDEEILDEAFRTTEAIRGELDKSLTTLRKMLNTVFDRPAVRRGGQGIIELTDRCNPERRA